MKTLAIEVQDLHKAYRVGKLSTSVLRGVNLEIVPGECVFLVGPSGSGKSTLLSILGCILTPDRGVLKIMGDDVTRLNAKRRAAFRRSDIGFVFQRFHLFRGLKAWENVRVSFDLLGVGRSEGRRESLRLLDSVGIGDKAFSDITELSMGQRQRVALARALAGDPKIILADEPTASLDAQAGLQAMGLLKDLSKRIGSSVVVVTHDPRIGHLADRILRMEDGQVVSSGFDSPQELREPVLPTGLGTSNMNP